MTKILGVIPARYASTRFPGKPLALIGNKSMIQRVYEQARKSTFLSRLIVATDHELISDHVKSFGGEVCITSEKHPSGTDRCQEVKSILNESFDYVVNIQGDEPFIAPEQIDLLASVLDGKTELATLIKKIDSFEQLVNPNNVRVVFNTHLEAIYFSRAAIPYLRGLAQDQWLAHHVYFKHIGMYAYRTDILEKITTLPISSLERAESLEQLRWLENGLKIKVVETNIETMGIDTPEDLERATLFVS